MKKIFMILMMVFGLSAVFAYEPKKENAKVKRNGDVVYHEKTELYNRHGSKPDPRYPVDTDQDYVRWVIRKGYTVDQLVEYKYDLLEHLRRLYSYNMERVESPVVAGYTKVIVDALNEINGTNETYEEHATKSALERAWCVKRTAAVSIPYVTVDNFLTLTKEEMLARMLGFVEEVKAESK